MVKEFISYYSSYLIRILLLFLFLSTVNNPFSTAYCFPQVTLTGFLGRAITCEAFIVSQLGFLDFVVTIAYPLAP